MLDYHKFGTREKNKTLHTNENDGESQKKTKICKTTVIRDKVSTGGNLQDNLIKYMTK